MLLIYVLIVGVSGHGARHYTAISMQISLVSYRK